MNAENEKILSDERPVKKDRRKLYTRLVMIAAALVIVLSVCYSLLTFFTHGDSDSNNPYKIAWLRGLTAGGGLYSDTLAQGSEEAVKAAIDDKSFNLLLHTVLTEDGSLKLDYENGGLLKDRLALTKGGKCNVIIQINGGGMKAAEELCSLLTDMEYEGNLAVQSADIEVLQWLSENRPYVLRGIVTGDIDELPLSGFEKFCHRNMLLNFKCRPHYAVFDAEYMPTVASSYISREMPVLAVTSDINDITALSDSVYGFILEGYSFLNEE